MWPELFSHGERTKEKTLIELYDDYHQSFLALERIAHELKKPDADTDHLVSLQTKHERLLRECEQKLTEFQKVWDNALKRASG